MDAFYRSLHRPALALLAMTQLVACTGTSTQHAGRSHPGAVSAPRGDVPASFFPADYEGELLVDFAAMRDNGLLDQLERMPFLDGFLDALARGFGISLDDVERIRTAVVYDPIGARASTRTVSVVDVGDSESPRPAPDGWTAVHIGHFDVWQRDDGRSSRPTLLQPRSGIVVVGGHDLLEPILDGTGRGGRAHPELRPMTAGRRLLMQYAFGCFGRPVSAHLGSIGFPASLTDPEDPIELARLRLAEDPEGSLELSATMRFGRGTSGVDRIESAIQSGIASVAADPRLAVFASLLDRVHLTRDGRDLTIALPLGTPRAAIGTVERVVLAAMRLAEQR